MRILEVTRSGFFKALAPDSTHWIRWGHPLTVDEPDRPEGSGLLALARTLPQLRRRRYDLVVLPAIHPEFRYDAPPHKLFAKSALRSAARLPQAAQLLNLLLASTRHIIVDIGDDPQFCWTTIRLFPRSSLYFKRELDLDRAPPPCSVRHLPLFVPNEMRIPPPAEKDIDVLFASALCNDARKEAMAAVASLAGQGLRVVIPREHLPYGEFMATLARSWLVVSPEGYGWDCYRHYEICLAGAVPVINWPNYRRHLYLQDAVHCFYYDRENGGLTRLLAGLLANKPRLAAIAADARRHVLANYTRSAIARYMLGEIIRKAAGPDGSFAAIASPPPAANDAVSLAGAAAAPPSHQRSAV